MIVHSFMVINGFKSLSLECLAGLRGRTAVRELKHGPYFV